MIAQVLPDVPAIDRVFDYVVPAEMASHVAVGSMVRVRLHGRRVGGWVVALAEAPTTDRALQPIAKVRGVGPPPALVEQERVGHRRVEESELAGVEDGLLAILNDDGPAAHLQAEEQRPLRIVLHQLGGASHRGARGLHRQKAEPPDGAEGEVGGDAVRTDVMVDLDPNDATPERVSQRLLTVPEGQLSRIPLKGHHAP